MTEAPQQRATFTIQPLPPFDFAMTADYATYFRGRNLWEFYENGVYRRVVDLPGQLGVAAVRSLGSVDAPLLEVEVAAPSLDDDAVAEARRQVEWVFQTQRGPRPLLPHGGGRLRSLRRSRPCTGASASRRARQSSRGW